MFGYKSEDMRENLVSLILQEDIIIEQMNIAQVIFFNIAFLFLIIFLQKFSQENLLIALKAKITKLK